MENKQQMKFDRDVEIVTHLIEFYVKGEVVINHQSTLNCIKENFQDRIDRLKLFDMEVIGCQKEVYDVDKGFRERYILQFAIDVVNAMQSKPTETDDKSTKDVLLPPFSYEYGIELETQIKELKAEIEKSYAENGELEDYIQELTEKDEEYAEIKAKNQWLQTQILDLQKGMLDILLKEVKK